MSVKIFSCMSLGLEGRAVEVEADILQGLPAFTIVGLGDTAVQEAKERIRSAIKNSGFAYPQTKKIINLAPAHLKKHGPQFDLPMAVSLLAASGQIEAEDFSRALVFGELALDGSVRAVNGVLTMALFARNNGWERIIIPEENYAEASLVKGLEIIPVERLSDIGTHLLASGAGMAPCHGTASGEGAEESAERWGTPDLQTQDGSSKPKNGRGSLRAQTLRMGNITGAPSTPGTGGGPAPRPNHSLNNAPAPSGTAPDLPDFSDILGQEEAKRALIIAAAGGHHLLLFGPPGTGKTMLAKAMPGIIPPLAEEELFEVLQIYSCAGLFHEFRAFPGRPFRQVHNTCSLYALTGGGAVIKPGEISLAHRGVLFLDEIAEFPRLHLESLRQPLESGEIHLARASGSIRFPSKFMLVAGMNPCPCGYQGDPEKECVCRPYQVIQYHKKISGPIMDRIDLHIEVPRQHMKIFSGPAGETSAQIRERVIKAREIQSTRFARILGAPSKPGTGGINPGTGTDAATRTNASLSAAQIKKLIHLTPDCEDFLLEAGEKLRLSGRGLHQIIKISRTIADLAGREDIGITNISEAMQYRKKG